MLELLPMETADRDLFFRQHMEEYAADLSRTQDLTLSEAREKTATLTKGLILTHSRESFHHIVLDGTRVGGLWLTRFSEEILFVSYLYIRPEHRGQGLGGKALALVDDLALKSGARQVWLHVFADNSTARAVYTKAGFRESGIQMFKNLRG